ncbi:craniofacial development-like protein [Perilla frutescens var. hirtella]|nr:craniofacial development-like protein [Perilla frutescens var. frutescens]KAH6800488.1 craniofacial development-like protein [Perilla frutescens var. hirtella]
MFRLHPVAVHNLIMRKLDLIQMAPQMFSTRGVVVQQQPPTTPRVPYRSLTSYDDGAALHSYASDECQRIFRGYLNHVEETFGDTSYDVGASVKEALRLGFEMYMSNAAPRRPLSDFISILEEFHHLSILRSERLRQMLFRHDLRNGGVRRTPIKESSPYISTPIPALLLLFASLVSGSVEKMETCRAEPAQEDAPVSQAQPEDMERKARVDAVWQQMNKGVSSKTLKNILENRSPSTSKTPRQSPVQKSSTGWKTYLGLGSTKAAPSPGQGVLEKRASVSQNGSSEDAKKLAAAALSAVKDAAALATTGKGKVEVTEFRDFAGEEIEVKKLVDAASKEAIEKGKGEAGVDAILEQIKKKPKLSVLDKTKKDWGEFKDENRGMEDELDAYKKSSNQYLDKVSFLQRADYREFERERDVRLASQSRRKTDMRDD